MKNRMLFVTVSLFVLLSFLLTACGPQATPVPTEAPAVVQPTEAPAVPTEAPAAAQPTEAPAVQQPASSGQVYALVPKNLGNPYFDTANKGAQEAAKELGVTVNYTGPATADATQQIQLLNSLIAQKV